MKKTGGADHQRGPIAWMAGNSVAANLLMMVLLVGGFITGLYVKQEVFPEFDLDMVVVAIAYPGASPEEVESGIVLAVEEAVQNLDGIDEIRSTAAENVATITIEALEDANIVQLWQEVKSEVDRIDTFPDEAKEPQVSIASRKRNVLMVTLHGDTDEYTLREVAERVRDEMLLDENITQVELSGVREYEIEVEISQTTLRRYGLTIQEVADTISRASVELGGGTIETSGGDVLVRVKDRRDYARDYASLPVISSEDGTRILLGEIATVREGFRDSNVWANFNGHRAVMLDVYRVGDQTPTQVADAAKAVLKRLNQTLPQGLRLDVLRDASKLFSQRADLLLTNAYIGLFLVFVFLAFFLEARLAFWVSLGIPISFLGSFLFLSLTPFSINMVTMFAFIVTLGIVVDDAVVVGENIYHYRRLGLPFGKAAVMGVREVAMPVVFSILTNMVAFLPLFFVPGILGKIFKFIPLVVLIVFFVSLIESLLVLPAHLSHRKRSEAIWPLNRLERWQERFSRSFERFVYRRYGSFLVRVLVHRYAVLAVGVALLLATFGFISSGRMGLTMFPKVESDYAYCEVQLPYGSPESRLTAVEDKLVAAANAVASENGGETLSEGVFSEVEENKINARFFLTDPEIRPLGTAKVTTLWRQRVGQLVGVESISFESDRGGPGSGKGLTIQLSHRDKDRLDHAGIELAEQLSAFSIIHDIDDGSASGKRQFDIRLRPAGERMGLTSREVGNQVRHAFQGIEAVQQQRGRNEVTIRVRFPKSERVTEATLEDLVLQAPRGEILLRDAVTMVSGRAYTIIDRTNGRRVISVTANVRPPSQAENVLSELRSDILPNLVKRYPGLTYSFEGHQAEIRDSIRALLMGLGMALIGIYALLAVPFKSYVQPLIIMFCIPFGIIGAVVGHVLMGYSLSVISLFGIVALSGVVVNDSLVLIDFANRKRRSGLGPVAALKAAGVQRFRPILLTTLTTFGGLSPMILETSRQARFLVPMAISLGFGILFATLITLVMVPALYLVFEDVASLFKPQKFNEGQKGGTGSESLPQDTVTRDV